jgi:hypothetical protein
MKVFLLLLSLTVKVNAAPVSLSVASFQVHVRPQMVGILQDFRQLLATFEGYPSQILELAGPMDNLQEAVRALARQCPTRLTRECQDSIKSVLTELRRQEGTMLRMQAQVRFPDGGIATLRGLEAANDFERARGRLAHLLESELLAVTARNSTPRPPTARVVKMASELGTHHALMLIAFIPPRFRDDFESGWLNFFRPLQLYARGEPGAAFITTNLEQLNFYWNLLNMRLTKRTKNLPPGMSGPLNAIQNRWNQVVRTCYGQ